MCKRRVAGDQRGAFTIATDSPENAHASARRFELLLKIGALEEAQLEANRRGQEAGFVP
jgi:hypothetical protein